MSIAEINYLRCTRWRARQLGGNRRQLLATLFSQYPRFWTPDPESRPRGPASGSRWICFGIVSFRGKNNARTMPG